MAIALRRFAALLSTGTLIACGPPPFVVHVLYPGEVDVERGAPVVYQGVIVGEVAAVELRQDDPRKPARVAVSLEIRDRGIVLRESDRFHLSSLRGVPVVEIAPAPEPSEPLPTGASVAGVPPLVTRAEESLAHAIESLGALALERLEEAIDEIAPPPSDREQSGRDGRAADDPGRAEPDAAPAPSADAAPAP